MPPPPEAPAGRAAGAGRRRATRTAATRPAPGSIQAAANGERPGSERNRTAGRDVEPAQGGRDVEQVVEHLAARLAEQGVVGAGGLHQRVEPRADPVQAADPHAPARLGVAQAPSGRRGDVPEPPRRQLAPVEPLEHVVGEAARDPAAARDRVGVERRRRRRAAGSTSRGRRPRASGRDRTAGPAGPRSRARAPRTPRGAAGRERCRPGRRRRRG